MPVVTKIVNLQKTQSKKQKVSLETRVKLAVLHAYVENQAILESIIVYHASKHKQMKRPGYQEFFSTPILPSYVTNIKIFLSSVKIQKCRDQTLSKNVVTQRIERITFSLSFGKTGVFHLQFWLFTIIFRVSCRIFVFCLIK